MGGRMDRSLAVSQGQAPYMADPYLTQISRSQDGVHSCILCNSNGSANCRWPLWTRHRGRVDVYCSQQRNATMHAAPPCTRGARWSSRCCLVHSRPGATRHIRTMAGSSNTRINLAQLGACLRCCSATAARGKRAQHRAPLNLRACCILLPALVRYLARLSSARLQRAHVRGSTAHVLLCD